MVLLDSEKNWDLVIIGGGITGAGIFREAVRNGLKTLLVEQKDFAWGTSSRSSKLVHGGLRYLKEGHVLLTWESVRERERLIKEAPGLVEPLNFMFPIYKNYKPGRWTMEIGLSIYDFLAFKKRHCFYDAEAFFEMEPLFNQNGLRGGFVFMDTQVDDARLVLRLIHEAIDEGGTALNYTSAVEIIRNTQQNVSGVIIEDSETAERKIVTTNTVINATGAWAEKLHASPDPKRHLRPLRGSHIIFPSHRIPITCSLSFHNPKDRRPLFVVPWEGAVILGTTDIDHHRDLSEEPSITKEEINYMLEGINTIFPSLQLSKNDAIASFAGIRPVLSKGNTAPSKESREHTVWADKGLVTVTGGKLTTFRNLAWDALKAAQLFLKGKKLVGRNQPIFNLFRKSLDENCGLSLTMLQRLYGRYGISAEKIITDAKINDLDIIPGTHTIWAELPYVASFEKIRHFADLMLRRVRIGLLTRNGGIDHIERIRELCEPVLSWDQRQWDEEINNYVTHWERVYSPDYKNT